MGVRSTQTSARTAANGHLTLAQFCELESLSDREMARLFDIHPSHANRLRRRVAVASPALAYRISQYTRGLVSMEQLLFKH